MINPDEKTSTASTSLASVLGPNTLVSKNGTKQGRRRLGQTSKAVLSASSTAKRTRNSRSSKLSRLSVNPPVQQPDTSVSEQISPADLSSLATYEPSQWTGSQVESENSLNPLYEHEFYSTSINPTLTNGNGNSTGGLSSVYSFDDGIANYPANQLPNNNSSDYSYSHYHPHTLYHPQQQPQQQQQHGTYPLASTNSSYYQQQALLNEHLPMDSYSTVNVLNYSLPLAQPLQQQQQQLIDPIDDQQSYLRAQSRSSQSSSTSLSPPMLTANNPLGSSSSSASSSSSYSYSHKTSSSLSGGYHHLNSNGTLTLYGHHHQHHSNIESLLHLNGDDEGNDGDDDDDDDLSTLVHHHHVAMNDDFPSNHYPPANSILRTVLKRSAIGQSPPSEGFHLSLLLPLLLSRSAQSTSVTNRFRFLSLSLFCLPKRNYPQCSLQRPKTTGALLSFDVDILTRSLSLYWLCPSSPTSFATGETTILVTREQNTEIAT